MDIDAHGEATYHSMNQLINDFFSLLRESENYDEFMERAKKLKKQIDAEIFIQNSLDNSQKIR